HLRRAGKRIVILSNAPRRAAGVIRRVSEIGIPRALYNELLSSGEATWRWVKDGQPAGQRLFPIMAAADRQNRARLDLEPAPIEAADFILNTGVESSADKIEDFEAVLRKGVARDLLMVCANPDLVVIHAGKQEICAGALALRYEQLGGRVQYFGKPHPPIYRDCLALLGIAERRRILAVGDSLRTDIAAANAAGRDGLLVLGGIHQEELAGGELDAIVGRHGIRPKAAVVDFRW